MNVPPAVIHILHASAAIPEDIRRTLLLSDDDLEVELLRMTDRYTDEVFVVLNDIAVSVKFPVNRLVVAPERFVEDEQDPVLFQGASQTEPRSVSHLGAEDL